MQLLQKFNYHHIIMNSPHHHHHEHHDVHQQRLLWFFSFCNQRSGSSSNSSSAGSTASHERGRRGCNTRRKTAATRNKFALQYQQQLQQQQRQSSNVFGLDLTEHTQKFCDADSIPHIVKSCTRFIEKHGIIFGIYRLSGMRVNIHKLRQDFDKNPKITMIDSEAISNDAHAVACVLKQYFRELPTPLLTFHMYEQFIELFKQRNNSNNNNNNNNPDETIKNIATERIVRTADCKAVSKDGMARSQTSSDLISNSGSTDSNHAAKVQIENDNDIENKMASQVDSFVDDDTTTCDETTTKEATTTAPLTALKATASITTPSSTNLPPDKEEVTCGGAAAETTTSITQQPSRTKSALAHQQSLASIATSGGKQAKASKYQPPFTTSASDSQLISLSSVVTTTTSDVKYQVRLDDLKKLLHQLPRAHYHTLKFLMHHLACIAANGQKTGMDSKNVAIVWAPNLLKPRELELTAGIETLQVIGLQAVITEQLIKHHKFLFDEDENMEAIHEACDKDIKDDDSDN